MTRSISWMAVMSLATVACGSGAIEEDRPKEESNPGTVVLDSLELAATPLEYAVVRQLPPDTMRLTGSVTYDAARVSHVGPRMQGRIREVPVEIGDAVREGDILAVLDSPELGAAQAEWFSASVQRDVNRRNYERAERLYRDGIVSERRRLEAEGQLRQAEGALSAAERGLAALGAEPDSAASSLFVLRAPLGGVVVDKHATAGEVVGSDARVFTVADLTRLWILLDVYESSLSRVAVGTPVLIEAVAHPDRIFHGRVGYIGDVVDTTSRTVKVRVELGNEDLALKPGMFSHADLVLVDRSETIGVSQSAIQTLEGNTVVFVPEGRGRFRATPVGVGRTRAGGWVEIRQGLALDDSVVTVGSFSLKADLLKESAGEEGDK